MKEAVEKSIEAKTFKECVGKMISHEAESHPDYPHDQIIAIAHEKCRERFPGHSKAELVYNMESNPLVEKQSQEAFLSLVKNTFERADWIEYALILKKAGKPIKEITERIMYKESWLKKWVNPIYQKVIEKNEESPDLIQEVIKQPEFYYPDSFKLLDFSISEIQKKERRFEGWGTVEVRDSQGDLIPIEALERVMPVNMKRGGVILFSHSNRHVGKLLSYKFLKKKVKDKYVPGLWLKGQIYNDYKIDDQAWESILLAQATGKSVLSLGGTPLKERFECEDEICFRKVEDLQLYEWSVTNLVEGSGGANPESTIEVAVEKSELIDESELFVKALTELSKDDLQLVDMLLGTCERCQEEYLTLIEKGLTDIQAKQQLYTELTKELEELDKMSSEEEKKTEESKSEEKTKETEEAKQGEDLAAVLQQIMATLQRIEAKVLGEKQEDEPDEEEKKPPTEEEEVTEEETPLKLSKTDVEALVKSEDFAKVLESAGFRKIETPAPTETRKEDLQKGTISGEKTYPSIEEIREARENNKLGELSEKYNYPA